MTGDFGGAGTELGYYIGKIKRAREISNYNSEFSSTNPNGATPPTHLIWYLQYTGLKVNFFTRVDPMEPQTSFAVSDSPLVHSFLFFSPKSYESVLFSRLQNKHYLQMTLGSIVLCFLDLTV